MIDDELAWAWADGDKLVGRPESRDQQAKGDEAQDGDSIQRGPGHLMKARIASITNGHMVDGNTHR
jgi:hypothetical protein